MERSEITDEQIARMRQSSEDELLRMIYYTNDVGRMINTMLLTTKGKLEVTEEEMKNDSIMGRKVVKKVESNLKNAICKEWKYCDKKKEFIDDLDKLVKAVVPLVVAATAMPLYTALAIAVLLVFKWGLDIYCKCSK